MSTPPAEAQTPEEVARAITDGFARALRDTPGAVGSLELNIEYALRAAAQAERERIAAELRAEAKQAEPFGPLRSATRALNDAAARLSPAPKP